MTSINPEITLAPYLLDARSTIPESGRGCATKTFRALTSGDSEISVSFGRFNASLVVSAFPPLRLSSSASLALALGSSYDVSFDGGPRPWLFDVSKFYVTGTVFVRAKN